MLKKHGFLLPGIVLGSILFFLSGQALAQFCGDNTPARPVAECVDGSGVPVACDASGAIPFWPADFRPGGARRGGPIVPNAIPLGRDSTQLFAGTTVPGARSGHEQFKSVDILDDRLYVAYNAGFQVWDLSRNPENPGKIAGRDGWSGHFLSFPGPQEQLNFIEDIDAVSPGEGQNVLIFLAGKNPVGPSLWEYDGRSLKQLYQDEGTTSRQVKVAEVGGVLYGLTTTDEGIAVYNLTAASQLETPCLDDAGGRACGAEVYRGEIPGLTLGRYLDVTVSDGRLFVASATWLYRALQIWELPEPDLPSTAIERFRGLGTFGAAAPEFFEYKSTTYLAFEHQGKLKIHEVDGCLDDDGCTNLGDCKAAGGACEVTLSTRFASERYLTYSESLGTPYLYFGAVVINARGSQNEQLFDISELGSADPVFSEVTADSGTYIDPCNGREVDYWGAYYPRNDRGLRDLYPRVGKFRGRYFYRAAQSILDIHVRENVVVDPQITVTADTPADVETGAHWFGDPITFTAKAQNCAPSGAWIWDQSSSKMVDGLDSTAATTDLTWLGCQSGAARCADEEVVVMAAPSSGCGTTPVQVQVPDPLVLKDPRAHVEAIRLAPSRTTFAAGETITFTADVAGKSPYVYQWRILNHLHQEVASGTGESLAWTNTCAAIDVPTILFEDGFESGQLSNWSVVASTQSNQASRQLRQDRTVAKGGGETFEVQLTLTTPDNAASDTDSKFVTLTPSGTVAFGSPALTVIDLGNGSFRLTANTSSGTEWRWEIEDPDGQATCSTLGACSVLDWDAQGEEIVYRWQQEGSFKVQIWARNACAPKNTAQGSGVVEVTDLVREPLEVTRFAVDDAEEDCTQSLGFIDCLVDRSILFEVSVTGDPQFLEVDWNGDGNFVTVTLPSNGLLRHTYTANQFNFRPKVRAVKGKEVSPARSLAGSLTITDRL